MKHSIMLLAVVSCLSSDNVFRQVMRMAAGVSIILLFLSILILPAARPALGQDILTFVETENGFAPGGIAEGELIISDGFQPYGEAPPPVEVEVYHFELEPFFGEVKVEVDGRNLTAANVAQVDVSVDQTFSSGVYSVIDLEYESDIDDGGIWTGIDGMLSGVTFLSLPDGLYFVRVRTTGGVDVFFGPVTFKKDPYPPLSSVTISKMFFAHFAPETTIVVIEGENFGAFLVAAGIAVQISDAPFANGNVVYTLEFDEIDEPDPGPDQLFGFIAMSADNFAAG